MSNVYVDVTGVRIDISSKCSLGEGEGYERLEKFNAILLLISTDDGFSQHRV